jgi:Copper transport outer membrane protein, MctB
MLDFRYHALSLVAVFVALAVGLLLGVAIGDKGLVSGAEQDLRSSLRHDVVAARDRAEDARRQLSDRKSIERDDFYPIMVGDRLSGARIGLIALGTAPNAFVDDTRKALEPTGGRLVSVSVIREPLDLGALASAARGTPYAKLAKRPELLGRLGRRVGQDFRTGGKVLSRLRPALLSRGRSSGTLDGLEGVVLVRTRADAEDATERARIDRFEAGLVHGLAGRGTRVVGVEITDTQPSSVPWMERMGLTSVDDLDLVEGRTALVYALTGEEGTFGVKGTANALLPAVVSR